MRRFWGKTSECAATLVSACSSDAKGDISEGVITVSEIEE